jgi:hypothetical protein
MDLGNPDDVWQLIGEKLRELREDPRAPDARQAVVTALEILAH